MKEILKKLQKIKYYINWRSLQIGPGVWKSVYKGSGMEFDKITRYDFGEDPRWINWAATARFGGQKVLKNTFIQEKELPVIIVADLSASMEFGTEAATKKRLLAELSAVIAHSAWLTGDSLGFIGYTSTVELFLPLRRSKQYKIVIPQSILEHNARTSGDSNLMAALNRLPKRKSLVFLISDFHDVVSKVHVAFKKKGICHDLIPVVIEDLREQALPRGGVYNFKDLETGKKRNIWLSRAAVEAFKRKSDERRQELKELFRLYRLDSLWINSTSDCFKELAELFMERRRRRL